MNRRLATVLLIGGVALAAVWLLPQLIGPRVISVAVLPVPVDGQPSQGSTITLADGTIAPSGKVRIDIAIDNPLPLPVTLGFHGPSFVAALAPADLGVGAGVWTITADDPLVGQLDDSPAAFGEERVATIDPGRRVVSMNPDGATIDVSGAGSGHTGRWMLVVTAYGVEAPPVVLSITGG